MAVFPGRWTWLRQYQNVSILNFTGVKDDGVVVTTGAIRREKLQSNRHHRQTNTQLFTSRIPYLSPNQQCQSSEGRLRLQKLHVNSLQSNVQSPATLNSKLGAIASEPSQ